MPNRQITNRQIAPSDLRMEAQRLIKSGTMPKLGDLLGVVSNVRAKYVPQIKLARTAEAAKSAQLAAPPEEAPDEFTTGGEESPVPPTGVTPPINEPQAKSLLLGKKPGVFAPSRGASSSIPVQGPLMPLHGPKI